MTFDDHTFGAIVGATFAGYGFSYLCAKGLEAWHRRKVERDRARDFLACEFGHGVPLATAPHAPVPMSDNQVRMNFGRAHSNPLKKTPWADSRDWTGR